MQLHLITQHLELFGFYLQAMPDNTARCLKIEPCFKGSLGGAQRSDRWQTHTSLHLSALCENPNTDYEVFCPESLSSFSYHKMKQVMSRVFIFLFIETTIPHLSDSKSCNKCFKNSPRPESPPPKTLHI